MSLCYSGKPTTTGLSKPSKPSSSPSIHVEYIWIDPSGQEFRQTCQPLDESPADVTELPEVKLDQKEGILKPQAIFQDPFRGGDSLLVMCDYYVDGSPLDNLPHIGCAITEDVTEYPFGQTDGFAYQANPASRITGSLKQYCDASSENSFGRQVMDAHYRCCLRAGIAVSGTNGEIRPSQWEYDIDPGRGISESSRCSMARYIMKRVCDMFMLRVSFDPKPVSGEFNGHQTMFWYRYDSDVFGPYLSVAWPLLTSKRKRKYNGRSTYNCNSNDRKRGS
jgi:glutamine synthetase